MNGLLEHNNKLHRSVSHVNGHRTEPPRSIGDLRRFYQLSIDMLGIASVDGYFQELSHTWPRTLGFPREELLAAPYLEFVHPEDRDATVAKSAALAHGEDVVVFENRYRCRDGSYRWLEWNSTPDLAEGLIYFVARDVTERKEMAAAQREIEERLRSKLDLIERQQAVINALSTPIIEVWDRVLLLPMLGVVDSVRAAIAMADLLVQVSQKKARFAILDLTGVDTVDTATAAHLLKLIRSIGLLGAQGVITGIQPSVAQTMVVLGVEFGQIVTLSNLRDGLRHCISRMRDGAGLLSKTPRAG
jgi:rsbT co-antagonist protein RsbR